MDFEKKVVNTFASNFATSGFRLIGTVILGRLLGPEGLGVFTVLCAFPLILVGIAGLGLPSAAVYFLSRNPERRLQIVNNLFLYTIVVGVALAAMTWAGFPLLEKYYFKQNVDRIYFAIICLGIPLVLFSRFGMAILQGLYRIKERNAIQILIRAIPVPAFLVFVWMLGWGITGALLGWAMAYVVVAFYALVYIKKDVPFSWRPTYEAMPDFFRYGNTAYLGQLVDQTEGHAVLLVLALFVGPSEVGMLSIAIVFSNFVLWPSTAIRRPMLPKLASMDPARAASAFIQVVQVGLFASFAFAAAVTVVSPYIIPLLYGKSFEGVVPLIMILVPGILAHAVVMIINGYFMSIGSPKRRVYINVFRVVSLLTGVVVGGFFGGIQYATLSMSACFILTMIVAVWLACWRNRYVKFGDLVVLSPAVVTYFRQMSFKVKHLLQ